MYFDPLGTTWVQHIANLIKHQGQDDTKQLLESVPWPESAFIPMKVINQMPSPRIFKSHSPYHMMVGDLPHTSQQNTSTLLETPRILQCHSITICVVLFIDNTHSHGSTSSDCI